ncbi:MAG TPA: helix-turn-helix domain-containing protein [Chloroflexota bacterium]|nr:helix-turn-helix domain-containing protein [Chloroflexota bacterium]
MTPPASAALDAPVEPAEDLSCPVVKTMCLLEQKWTLQIIKELVLGKRRFCQLQHALRGDARHGKVRDVNPKTLSQRLKTLETYGIVTRRMVSDIPPNVEYELTCRGHDLVGIVESIESWAHKWMQPCPPAEDR